MQHEIKGLTIDTSEAHGKDFCGEACEHLAPYTKFPEVYICKITGVTLQPDKLRRMTRPDACKYLTGEEVQDRFWSPMKA